MTRSIEPHMRNCVRELRLEFDGMTQQFLADQVGVTRQTVIALEGGAYTPSLALALRISKVFRKPVEKVFWLEE